MHHHCLQPFLISTKFECNFLILSHQSAPPFLISPLSFAAIYNLKVIFNHLSPDCTTIFNFTKFECRFLIISHQSVPPLSLLPLVRNQPSSPRRVSSKYPVYISPHNMQMNKPTQPKGISYCINRSPAKVSSTRFLVLF